jgi:hypothetical protein
MASGHDLRRDRDPLFQRLSGALIVSLLAHISFFGVIRLGTQLQWWDARPFKVFRSVKLSPDELAKALAQQQKLAEEREKQQPVMFIQVTEPSEEPPPESKFYSSVSSRAANPDPGNEKQAKIDGQQERTARLNDAPRLMTGRPTAPARPEPPGTADPSPETASSVVPVPVPEPVRPPSEVPKLVEATPEPVRPPGVGDLAMVRVEPKVIETQTPPPKPVDESPQPQPPRLDPPPVEPVRPPPQQPPPRPTEPRARPRTVTEAKLRQSLLAGEKMKQDGGVSKKGPVQMDAVGLSYGAYDEAMVTAVQNRWYALLDERRFAGGARGHVVVKFKLMSDGSVRNCEAVESSVDSLFTQLCVRSVSDPAPYEKWPSDMLRMIGSPMREMRFTFYYN